MDINPTIICRNKSQEIVNVTEWLKEYIVTYLIPRITKSFVLIEKAVKISKPTFTTRNTFLGRVCCVYENSPFIFFPKVHTCVHVHLNHMRNKWQIILQYKMDFLKWMVSSVITRTSSSDVLNLNQNDKTTSIIYGIKLNWTWFIIQII